MHQMKMQARQVQQHLLKVLNCKFYKSIELAHRMVPMLASIGLPAKRKPSSPPVLNFLDSQANSAFGRCRIRQKRLVCNHPA